MLDAWKDDRDGDCDFHGQRAAGAARGQLTAGAHADPQEPSSANGARRRSTGSSTATFSGIHGWYWENPGAEPIKVHVTSAGFYTSAVEIHSNRTRYPHTLKSLGAM